jgi:regulator of sirC expression with transglutaminase-like and TPR domain
VDKNLELFQRLALSGDERLAHPALVIARMEYPALDLSKYLDWFEAEGQRLASGTDASEGVIEKVQRLNRLLYEEHKFNPDTRDYYDPKNSYLNDVIERKLGIPITLSVVYMELARYLGLNLRGIRFPQHFLVRNSETLVFYIDAFHFGEILLRSDCESRFAQATGGQIPFSDEYLQPSSKVEILSRMLSNLKNIFIEQQRFERAVDTLNWTIAIESEVPIHFRDRGILLARLQCPDAALKDLEQYLKYSPKGSERHQIEDLVLALRGNKTTIH